MDRCDRCGSTDIEWVSPWKADLWEPAGGGFWECQRCGESKQDYDHQREMAIAKAEAEWDDRRGH